MHKPMSTDIPKLISSITDACLIILKGWLPALKVGNTWFSVVDCTIRKYWCSFSLALIKHPPIIVNN